MQTTLEITEQDIRDTKKYGLSDPILFALQRTTGTLWRMSEFGVAMEVTPPYRFVLLRGVVLERWQAYRSTGVIAPFEFVVQLDSESARHQDRRVSLNGAAGQLSPACGSGSAISWSNGPPVSTVNHDSPPPPRTGSERDSGAVARASEALALG